MERDALAKPRILVVDDSRLMRKAAQKMLGDEFDVATAEDGEDAWEQVQSDPTLQVIFTDLNMPRCNGYELLARVRAADDAGVQVLPVIIVTGAENDEAARIQALDMGATDFITKPFTTTDLVARARAHANNRRITQQLQAQTTLDPLTGLVNKPGFLDRLQQDLAYAKRHHQPLCLVRLEIHDFRRFFLYQGRDVAERLVQQMARLLRARIRKEDTAARIGLGGFALSLPGGELIGIDGMLQRLRAELAANPALDEEGQPVNVVLASSVISPTTVDPADAATLLELSESQLALPDASVEPAAVAPSLPSGAEIDAAMASAATAEVLPASSLPTQGIPAAPDAQAEPAATAAAAAASAGTDTLRLDPIIDDLMQGNAKPAQEKLPQIIGRLLPVLRLLGPNQRAQLIQFLQRLG